MEFLFMKSVYFVFWDSGILCWFIIKSRLEIPWFRTFPSSRDWLPVWHGHHWTRTRTWTRTNLFHLKNMEQCNTTFFIIKNVVAVAAYVRLASRSQAKFQNNEIESHSGFRAHPHLRRARYPPVVHFNSRLARVRMWHALSQWPSQAFLKLEKEVSLSLLHRSLVGLGSGSFCRRFGHKFDFIPSFVTSRSLLTRWQSHVIDHLPRNRNWSFLVARTTEDGAITTSDVSSAASMRDWLFAHKKLLVMCARTGCPKCGKRWRKQFNRSGNAMQLRQRRKSQEMDDSIEIHAPEEGLQVPPVKRRDDGSSKKLDSTKRADSATSSMSRATEVDSAGRPSRSRDKKKTLSSCVSVVGRSRSDGSPVPSGTKGSEHHRSRSGDRSRWSHGSERRHDSPRSRHSHRRRRNGEWVRPTSSSGGSSSRARHADSTDALGSGRASGRATEVRPSRFFHSSSASSLKVIGDRRSLSSEKSESSYVSRRKVQLSPVVPRASEKRTITVIPSPPGPARMDESTGVMGPTDSAALADSADVTGPTDSAEIRDSAGDESARDHDLAAVDEPEMVDDSAGVADPSQEQDPAGADSAHTQEPAVDDSAHPQDSAVDNSARDDGPVAQGTPAENTPAAEQRHFRGFWH